MTNATFDIVRIRRRRIRDPLLLVFATIAGGLALVAVLGPLLAPYDTDATDILSASQGPSTAHLLGTDSLGRDILSRALVGTRLSFAGPGIIVLCSAALGTFIALFSAWNGGFIDRIANRMLNVMFAVPGILVAVLASAIFGAGFWAPVIALSLVYTPLFARVVRSVAIRERRLPYVEALQLAGVRPVRICSHHLLPNLIPIISAQATIAFGYALVDFGAVSFLGLGVQPPHAEWGLMVADGRSEVLNGAVWQSLTAGMCVVLTVVTFNIVGERLVARFGGAR